MEEQAIRRKERLDRGIKVRSDTVYAVASWREILFLLAPRAGMIVVLLIAPLLVPSLYWQRVICIMGVYALLAVGFDFLGWTETRSCICDGTGRSVAVLILPLSASSVSTLNFSPCSLITLFERVPMPEISTSTVSPGLSCPTPEGVPVAITSPTSRVMMRDINLTR